MGGPTSASPTYSGAEQQAKIMTQSGRIIDCATGNRLRAASYMKIVASIKTFILDPGIWFSVK